MFRRFSHLKVKNTKQNTNEDGTELNSGPDSDDEAGGGIQDGDDEDDSDDIEADIAAALAASTSTSVQMKKLHRAQHSTSNGDGTGKLGSSISASKKSGTPGNVNIDDQSTSRGIPSIDSVIRSPLQGNGTDSDDEN
jgi:hypothetical protein